MSQLEDQALCCVNAAEKTEWDWSCVAAVNCIETLERNLAASPVLQAHPSLLFPQHDQASAAIAYNTGLAQTTTEIVVFAHQDVYLPRGWEHRLQECLNTLQKRDPDWAIAGLFGLTPTGSARGHVWSTGLALNLGGSDGLPAEATCLDELLIILKRSSGLCFDEALPGFHLYGTDIVQTALEAGYGAYIIDAPAVHNSRPVRSLAGGYAEAFKYMQSKHSRKQPIPTLIATIAPGDPVQQEQKKYNWVRTAHKEFLRRRRLLAHDWRWVIKTPSPEKIARRVGYERDQ